MIDVENVKKQEAVLCERISKDGQVLITIGNLNQFVDIIYINANKTNERLTLQVDLEGKTICFWNDCDESFMESMDCQGIDRTVDKLKHEFEETYYFQTINDSRVVSYPVKMDGIVDTEIVKKKAMEIRKYANETFDRIKVHNFIGSKRYDIKFCDEEIIVE